MSDNEYEDYGGEYDEYGYDDNNYDNDNMMDEEEQEEDYETKVELEYFEAEEMLRKGNVQECLESLENLYKLSIEHNLRNWKPKILNLQLQIYTNRQKNQEKLLSILEMIVELNRNEKYTESSIKSIIMTMKQLDKEGFEFVREKLYEFVEEMDELNRVRSLLMLVEREVDEGEYQEGQRLVDKVEKIRKRMGVSGIERNKFTNINNFNSNNSNNMAIITTSPSITTLPPSLLIELYSHQITLYKHLHHHNNNNKNNCISSSPITQLITRIHLTLPQLESESYLSDGHLSIIKESISEIKYQQENYFECSKLLCEAFQEQMKYGKDHNKKKLLLKINVLVALLTEDKEVYMKDKCNALYHESAASFKSENDVQSLYGLVEAFNNGDYVQFLEQMKTVNYFEQTENQEDKSIKTTVSYYYPDLIQKVITLIKSNKLLQIIKPYNKIKFSYLSRRLNCDEEQIYEIIFKLIMEGKIDGRIKKDENENEKNDYCLVINNNGNKRDEYLVGQLENVKGLLERKFV